jgi:formate hydrogenlyase subunit 6/NADH:ubiquinone oxidoreductase subunit I
VNCSCGMSSIQFGLCAFGARCSGYCTIRSLELFQLIELSAHAHHESIKRTAKFLLTYELFDHVYQR